MNDEYWYYEYQVKVWDNDNQREEIYSGIVPAISMAKATEEIENYYGDELMEFQMLKAITDGLVFEFQFAMEHTKFDYVITRKM